MSIIYRSELSSPMTWDQLDENFRTVEAIADETTRQAGIASEFAKLSRQASDAAQLSSASAQSFAESAQTEAGAFTTVEKGLLHTEDGQLFGVLSGSPEKLLSIYANVGGVAVDTGKKTASDEAVQRISDGNFPNVGLQWISLPVESGYVWALADKNQRCAILIDLNGRTVIPKLDFKIPDGSITAANLSPEISGFFPVSLSPETGYVWALVDKNLRFALAVTIAGKVVGNFDINIPSPEGFKYLIPQINLSYIGDSLTANSTFPAKLTALLSPVRQKYINAQGGQTSVQAAARTGAINSLVAVENSRIPASGSVAITAVTVRLLSTPAFNGGTFTAKGWLRGVYGTLTCVANAGGDLLDDYSFVRDVAGEVVYCPANTAFIPNIGERDFWTQIIWIGRNNLDSPETVKSDIQAMVEAQKTSQKRFLILTPPLGGTKTPGQSTTEGVGSTIYNNCVSIEDWAAKKYGDKVINVRLLLQQHGDGSADDNDDIAKGVVPRSLRSDAVHLLPIADGYVADDCAYILNFKGW